MIFSTPSLGCPILDTPEYIWRAERKQTEKYLYQTLRQEAQKRRP